MNSLPQRKKSAEEIAKLREAMGISGQEATVESSGKPESSLEHAIRESDHTDEAEVNIASPEEVPEPHITSGTRHPVRSLKRSERTLAPQFDEPDQVETIPDQLPERKKIVRSLRKSEQVPIVVGEIHTPPANSDLPIHRHSDKELDRIRRQGFIQMQESAVDPGSQIAHLVLVVPGYLFALAGAVCFYFYNLSISITASAAFIAAMIAGFIYLKRPFSRYHAAFIAVIVLFVVVFGALHYFPPLQDGP